MPALPDRRSRSDPDQPPLKNQLVGSRNTDHSRPQHETAAYRGLTSRICRSVIASRPGSVSSEAMQIERSGTDRPTRVAGEAGGVRDLTNQQKGLGTSVLWTVPGHPHPKPSSLLRYSRSRVDVPAHIP
jgi:hypothetical protein